jgi:hypothetical protein
LREANSAVFEPVKRRCLQMTTASGGDCVYMLLVGKNQKDIFWLFFATLPGGKNVICQSTIGQ